MNVIVRKAKKSDLASIIEIYNYAVVNTTATFDTEPKTVKSQREWFFKRSSRHPIIVAEKENEIIGWASLSQWSERPAYAKTVEISIYIDKNNQGLGVGKELFGEIIRIAGENGFHAIIARIAGDNKASMRLHQGFGFKYIGSLKEVGFKFNKYIDVHIMQIILD